MQPRVLIAEPDAFDADAHAIVASCAEIVLDKTSVAGLARAFEEFDAVWIRLGFRVTAEVIGDAPRCRVLACPATGLDHIDLAACRDKGIVVVSLKGEVDFLREVRATAELTVGLMLSSLRRLPFAMQSVLSGSWNRDLFRGHELHDKTIGLVGMGRLGTLVARMLAGFDVRILGHDIRPDFPHQLATRVASLDELLERSDIVSLHVSYDATTRHLIAAPQFERMRRSSTLVNTSRGGVVDEAALLRALENGTIAGAALDVVDGEPYPSSAVLGYARAHHNLIVVPHIGGNTWESTRKTELFIARKLLAALGLAVRE